MYNRVSFVVYVAKALTSPFSALSHGPHSNGLLSSPRRGWPAMAWDVWPRRRDRSGVRRGRGKINLKTRGATRGRRSTYARLAKIKQVRIKWVSIMVVKKGKKATTMVNVVDGLERCKCARLYNSRIGEAGIDGGWHIHRMMRLTTPGSRPMLTCAEQQNSAIAWDVA